MMHKREKGQSILEYVIVLIAIVACIVWAATKFIAPSDSTKNAGVGKMIEQTGSAMTSATNAIANIK